MICYKCFQSVDNDSNYCIYCGAKVSEQSIHAFLEAAYGRKIGSVILLDYRLDNKEVIKKCSDCFIAIDFETTGFSCYSEDIIEYSAVIFENGEVVKVFCELAKPNQLIPREATNVNSITNEMVRDCLPTETVMLKYYEFLKPYVENKIPIVAHNATFDGSFLERGLQQIGISCKIYICDTLSIERRLHKGKNSYKLLDVATDYKLKINGLHRAYDDAILCGSIFICQLDEMLSKIEFKKNQLSELEINIIEVIKNILKDANLDLSYLSFKKATLFSAHCLYPFLKMKTTGNTFYVIIPKEVSELITVEYELLPCSKSDGENNVRFVINNVTDIYELKNYVIESFKRCYESMVYYRNSTSSGERNILEFINETIVI